VFLTRDIQYIIR